MAYIAINAYRTSTSEGFANTWHTYTCSREQQRRLLREGLTVRDSCLLDSAGERHPMLSTMGIRLATRAERRAAAKHGDLARFTD